MCRNLKKINELLYKYVIAFFAFVILINTVIPKDLIEVKLKTIKIFIIKKLYKNVEKTGGTKILYCLFCFYGVNNNFCVDIIHMIRYNSAVKETSVNNLKLQKWQYAAICSVLPDF